VGLLGSSSQVQVVQGFVRQRIEAAGGDILLNLAVPCRRIELGEPSPKCGEFLSRKPPDSFLNLFNRAHVPQLTPPGSPAQPSG